MSARIDHAAEANEWIGDAPPALHGTNGETQNPTRAIVCALLAQAEATLALVEQHRIANLIALAESGRTTVNGARAALSALYDGRTEDGTAHMRILPDVAAALGIDGSAS